jgi:UDPglucose 6-dehydrogenase
VAQGADALLLLTEWKDYRDLDWARVYSLMARPLVLDARNALAPEKMKDLGFEYHSFGRPDLKASATPVSS